MLLIQMIALVMLIGVGISLLAQFSARLANFLRAYEDLLVLLVIVNLLTATIGTIVGMKVGYDMAGEIGMVTGILVAIVLGGFGASYAEELMD